MPGRAKHVGPQDPPRVEGGPHVGVPRAACAHPQRPEAVCAFLGLDRSQQLHDILGLDQFPSGQALNEDPAPEYRIVTAAHPRTLVIPCPG